LPPLDDSKVLFNLPASCHYERLAYYEGEQLYIVSDVWDQLTSTDKAGLYTHEIVYKYLRTHGPQVDSDSRRARAITSYLFSDSLLENIFKGIPQSSYVCQTFDLKEDPLDMWPAERTVFFLYKNGKKSLGILSVDGYTLQFIHMLNRPVLSKKTIELYLPDYELNLFTKQGPSASYIGGGSVSNSSVSLFQGGDTIAFTFDSTKKPTQDIFLSIRTGDQPIVETRMNKVECHPWKRF
jgi:hypothetical protein